MAGGALAVLTADGTATGQESAPQPPAASAAVTAAAPKRYPCATQEPSTWTGLYVGAHTAYGVALASNTLLGPRAAPSTDSLGSFLGGVHMGYNFCLPTRYLVGAEADISFPYFVEDGVLTSRTTAHSFISEKPDLRLDPSGPCRIRREPLAALRDGWARVVAVPV